MKSDKEASTAIAYHTIDRIFVRDVDLVDDLIGELSFTEMMYFQVLGTRPSKGQVRVLDAMLVAMMEHGFNASSVVARIIYDSTPEALQSAVAAGILGVGNTFIGTMEGAALLIDDMLASPNGIDARAEEIAKDFVETRRQLPGFGHPFHKPDDPRTPRLFAIARENGVEGRHIAAMEALSRAVDKAYGKHLTINVTGAAAAVFGEIGIPQKIMRGFAVVSRAAGLVGHIHEEQSHPVVRSVWQGLGKSIPYRSANEA